MIRKEKYEFALGTFLRRGDESVGSRYLNVRTADRTRVDVFLGEDSGD